MARQRPPIECPRPFVYWVFGRPVSTRNDDGGRPAALPTWRNKVNDALNEAVADASKGRGFVLIDNLVEIQACWMSVNPSDPSQPDVDNMLKPLIDALNKTVIDDDRQVHRIVAEKADINSRPRLSKTSSKSFRMMSNIFQLARSS